MGIDNIEKNRNHLPFQLDVENGWPPIEVENIPYDTVIDGYLIKSAPLFVKDISVGDILNVRLDEFGVVSKWEHLKKSKNTTIWIALMDSCGNFDSVLSDLRHIHCNTVSSSNLNRAAVDVPESVSIYNVDKILDELDQNIFAIAYPSFRHNEE